MFFYSSIEPIYYLLPLFGLIVGLFGTMLGGGGGFFFLPILTLFLNVPAQTAVITSLVATLPICIVGSWGHYRKNNVNFRIGGTFAVVGFIGALTGAYITSLINAKQLQAGFGIYSLLIALNMFYANLKEKRQSVNAADKTKEISTLTKVKGSFMGFSAGTITGIFGTSGTAPILAGLFTMRMPLKITIGTSLIIVLSNTLFAVGAHFLISQVDLTLVFFLSSGSVIGALIGPHLMSKSKYVKSESSAKYVYALVIAVLGIIMILK